MADRHAIAPVPARTRQDGRASASKDTGDDRGLRAWGDLIDAARQIRLTDILASAVDAVVSTGPDHRILYFNPAAERMFGVAVEDVVGTDIGRFIPGMTSEDVRATRETVRARRSPQRMGVVRTLRAVRATGEEFPVEASISRTGSGDAQLITMIVRDRTEHERLQAQLLQAQKLEGMGRLAGGVAHDFNNLLTVILGYCELLQTRQRGGVELEEITNAARRASQLTRQMLAFSRRQVLQVETLDLNALVHGLTRMLRRVLGEDVALQMRLADEHLWVVADVGQMEQVLLNLAVNARDAMPSGGTLRITTRVADCALPPGSTPRPSVELLVSDTSRGVSEDARARIFEPFATASEDAAAGLGLATVYGIVRQTGGDVACTSAVGQGTTFHVWLPLADAPRAGTADALAERHASRGSEGVLLVEDDAPVRELTARALRAYGYTVFDVADVAAASRVIEHAKVAIVVSDVVMPRPDGADFFAEIARRRPGLPVLLVTGSPEALRQRQVDPAHLLRKPFTPADLAARIRALLDGPRR